MKRLIKSQAIFISVVIMFLASFAFAMQGSAATQNPVALMQGMADKMIIALEKNKSRLKQHGVIRNIVDQNLVPYVDVNRMGASVVGRNYWMDATPKQRGQFIGEFKRLVTSTYSAALASYDGDKVKVYPLRGGVSGSTVTVHSVIVRRSGQKIPIDYYLIRRNGHWKIYDFSIESISMVRSYRSQFSGVLANSGMPGLIHRLIAHNKKVNA